MLNKDKIDVIKLSKLCEFGLPDDIKGRVICIHVCERFAIHLLETPPESSTMREIEVGQDNGRILGIIHFLLQ